MMPTAVRRVTAIHPPCSTFESDGAQSNPDLAAKVLGALVRLFQMYLLGDAALPHDHPGGRASVSSGAGATLACDMGVSAALVARR
jgi:hypothetical protein